MSEGHRANGDVHQQSKEVQMRRNEQEEAGAVGQVVDYRSVARKICNEESIVDVLENDIAAVGGRK